MLRFVTALLIAVLASLPAAAQSLCGQRTDVLKGLNGSYTETPSAMGLSNNGGVVEILTSPKGMSCLIASGEGWQPLAPAPSGPSV